MMIQIILRSSIQFSSVQSGVDSRQHASEVVTFWSADNFNSN